MNDRDTRKRTLDKEVEKLKMTRTEMKKAQDDVVCAVLSAAMFLNGREEEV